MRKLFSIRDLKLGDFGKVVESPNLAVFMRELGEILSTDSMLSKFCSDYEIYEIGDFNEKQGIIIPREKPLYICSAQDVKDSQVTKNQINMFQNETKGEGEVCQKEE